MLLIFVTLISVIILYYISDDNGIIKYEIKVIQDGVESFTSWLIKWPHFTIKQTIYIAI